MKPDDRRIEILETNQEFAGDTGLHPTGTGIVVAALTPTGLTSGQRCRGVSAEKYPTWIRCGLYGSVLIDAVPSRRGYRLTIGRPPNATVEALLLPNRQGNIAFSVPTCRRLVVTENVIP